MFYAHILCIIAYIIKRVLGNINSSHAYFKIFITVSSVLYYIFKILSFIRNVMGINLTQCKGKSAEIDVAIDNLIIYQWQEISLFGCEISAIFVYVLYIKIYINIRQKCCKNAQMKNDPFWQLINHG